MNHGFPNEIIFGHRHLQIVSQIDLDFEIDYDPDSYFKEDHQLGINTFDTTQVETDRNNMSQIQWYVIVIAYSVVSADIMDATMFKGIVA